MPRKQPTETKGSGKDSGGKKKVDEKDKEKKGGFLRVFKKIFTPEMSHAFETYFAARGVRFLKQTEVKEARGEGRLASVVLADGRTLDCDLMVVGIGVQPLTRVAADTSMDVADGVVVNEYLETGVPGFYAAGDFANAPRESNGAGRKEETGSAPHSRTEGRKPDRPVVRFKANRKLSQVQKPAVMVNVHERRLKTVS